MATLSGARWAFGLALGVAPAPALALPPAPAGVEVTTTYGIEFSTVGHVGNAPWVLPGEPGISFTRPTGAVGYEFRIGRTEVTTGQWMDFLNTFSTRYVLGTDDPAYSFFNIGPAQWGAVEDATYQGPGVRYVFRSDLPQATMTPVTGISWRAGAMFCNWLHNERSTEWSSLTHGAYDTSTFGGTIFEFTDQLTHSPGARFWIPTLDEWVKAAFYDPARDGPGQGGYWTRANRSDGPVVYGPPGSGQANSGFQLPFFGEAEIPLGSYALEQSAYGLLDAMGGVNEWTEGVWPPAGTPRKRVVLGSSAGLLPEAADYYDALGRWELGAPDDPIGLRIAAQIPGPWWITLALLGVLTRGHRSRKEYT